VKLKAWKTADFT